MTVPEHISVVYVEDDERLARLTQRYLESHGVLERVLSREQLLDLVHDVALELPDGGPDSWRNVGGEVGSRYTVMGLQNGVRYLVRRIAIDEAENRSAPSSPVEATPVATAGFLERYKESGGSEVGCGSSLPGLLLSCLAGQGRRRR
jgi:hypothetical protein